MAESLKSKLTRWLYNLWPCYFGTGASITYIAGDWREVRIAIPLSWRTRNYVGTIYGGSMYGAVDPIYMVMLIKNLGPRYVVWDKVATIRFKKPGKSTLYARFTLDPGEPASIEKELEHAPSTDRVYLVDLTDEQGTIHATVEKTIFIAHKDTFQR